MRKLFILKALTVICTGVLAANAGAQMPMEIYENPQNLEVLPADISPEALRDVMFSFGQQVDLRCSKCHAFEPDTPVEARDYASDERELKRVTREMMRMVERINENVASIDRGPDHEPVTVQCITCHRRVPRPRQIDEEFALAIAEGGVSAAIERYRGLRKDGYGMGTYDFTAWRLGGIAQAIVDSGDVEGGMRVHALNHELDPDDGSVYYHRAESFEKLGRIGEAIEEYEHAMRIEPSFGFLDERIERLKAELDD